MGIEAGPIQGIAGVIGGGTFSPPLRSYRRPGTETGENFPEWLLEVDAGALPAVTSPVSCHLGKSWKSDPAKFRCRCYPECYPDGVVVYDFRR